MTNNRENTEVESMTRRSIAKLIAHRRGEDNYDESDYTTACNIMMVTNRYVKEKMQEINSAEILASDLYDATKYIIENDKVLKVYSVREPAHFMRIIERTIEWTRSKVL